MIYSPKPHHVLGIQHLLGQPRAALFAGMGLGKTGITLAALGELLLSGASVGALVIAPKRVATLTWPDEVAAWENFRWMRIANLRTDEGYHSLERGDSHLYILNVEQIPQFVKRYLFKRRGPLAFDTVILDELTKFKNPNSKRAELLRHYLHKIPRRWGLTGTPNPNSLLELYGQIRMLDDGAAFGRSFAQFRDCYFHKPHERSYDYRLNPGAAELIHSRIAGLSLVLRSSDYLEIPEAVLEDIEVPMPPATRPHYEQLQEELLTVLRQGRGDTVLAVNAAVLAGKLLQMTGGAVYSHGPGEPEKVALLDNAKLAALQRLLKTLKEPAIVVCHYRHERARLLKALPGAESFTDCKDEGGLLARWNAKQVPVLVVDPRSVGHGLNMQAGGRVTIWFSVSHSRELYDQTNARTARTGQKLAPLVYRLISPGTIDEAVIETLRVRLEGQQALQNCLVALQRLMGS